MSGNHVTFIKADITNLALLKNIFQKYKPDYVFHLAARANVPQSVNDPLTTHEINVTGTLNTLLAARDIGTIKKFVFISNCTTYGNPSEDAVPIKETQSPDPLSPYATSKLVSEQYCNIFSKTYNLPTICLRYSNVYGPRQDPNSEYTTVIPKFISRIKQDKPLIIYGDGTQTRDFIYVDDVVHANIVVAISNGNNTNNTTNNITNDKDKNNGSNNKNNNYQTENATTNVFNVGTGDETSIHFLANTLLSIYGGDLENIEYKSKCFGDI